MDKEWPLNFKIISKCGKSKARAGILTLPHGVVETPVFMPVGTHGTVKGILPEDLNEIGEEIILGNTYHLGIKPGVEIIKICGGLHGFMNWKRNILTDSGGFQMVSLSKLSTITEEGVKFKNPYDGSICFLTPEKSIEIQMGLGSDIMMQLDDVVPSTTIGPRVEEAMRRSIRWLDRCLNTIPKDSKNQNLFPIIQGGLDSNLRKICIKEMTMRNVPGFAIGGLSGGEDKKSFCHIVDTCTDHLPYDKPRYLMGVGYTLDLIVCTALGCDMFDCVFPTRTARFGRALTKNGPLDLKQSQYNMDFEAIDKECTCTTCKSYPRSHIHYLLSKGSTISAQLITLHNLSFQKSLMTQIRNAIINDSLNTWIINFLKNYEYNGNEIFSWVKEALKSVNIYYL